MKIALIILGIVLFIFFLTKFIINSKESENEYMQEQLSARDYWRWKYGGID